MSAIEWFIFQQDLVSTINGFDSLVKIPKIFASFSSKLIKRLTQFAPDGEFPDFKETITFFKVSFQKSFVDFFHDFLLKINNFAVCYHAEWLRF